MRSLGVDLNEDVVVLAGSAAVVPLKHREPTWTSSRRAP